MVIKAEQLFGEKYKHFFVKVSELNDSICKDVENVVFDYEKIYNSFCTEHRISAKSKSVDFLFFKPSINSIFLIEMREFMQGDEKNEIEWVKKVSNHLQVDTVPKKLNDTLETTIRILANNGMTNDEINSIIQDKSIQFKGYLLMNVPYRLIDRIRTLTFDYRRQKICAQVEEVIELINCADLAAILS